VSDGSRSKERSVLGKGGGAKPLKDVSIGDVDWPMSGLNRLGMKYLHQGRLECQELRLAAVHER
jgi:hypothetical protein